MAKLKIATVLFFLLFVVYLLYKNETREPIEKYLDIVNDENIIYSSPAIQMYFYIKKYSKQYNIPEEYAFAIAYQETRYQGPLDHYYNPRQTSYAGAVGPMQIMPSTANYIHGKRISVDELRKNIKLNVETSMMLLKHLYSDYHDWGAVFGYYNTGIPCVNGYAKNVLHKNYIWKK